MRTTNIISAVLSAATLVSAQAELAISARTGTVGSDWTSFYYNGASTVLVGNDGDASTGGFRAWPLGTGEAQLNETAHVKPGRTKLVTTVYGAGGKDLIITITQPDSYFRLYDARTFEQVGAPLTRTLGDWSALCAWRSPKSNEQYVFLFGKTSAVQFFLRKKPAGTEMEMIEVRTFPTPFEASSCAVSAAAGSIFFSGDDSKEVWAFNAEESTATPNLTKVGEASDDVTGLAVYVGLTEDYLIVAQTDVVSVHKAVDLTLLGTMKLTGAEDIEVQGLSLFQQATTAYPAGVLGYALETDGFQGFGISSLEAAVAKLGLKTNTAYNPRRKTCKPQDVVCQGCSYSGICSNSTASSSTSCSCFAGFTGTNCSGFTCRNDCSGHGTCVGANQCKCDNGWGGLYCAFKVVEPVLETDANGGDGDDPAIWVHPTDKSLSRVITTTKSEGDAGLGVFALNGTQVGFLPAGEPNNVDVIYGFKAGNRTVDLAYAACRTDDTLCLFEIKSDGSLATIAGGVQPTKDDYSVYGSCVYRSRKTGKQYLFVNAKSAEYLQFELTWADNALHTTLVRSFTGGSGGQVEGCVSDEANGWVLIGEEPLGLWRYDAEPDGDTASPVQISFVGDGKTYADVEGVTLVEGKTKDQGFILVSQQGVSAYNVYKRAAPHAYVTTFTVMENVEKGVDGVTNTDGLAAVGAGLNAQFPHGLIVLHDDANQLAGGGTSDAASFKYVSLGDVLGEELLGYVDPLWDPRANV